MCAALIDRRHKVSEGVNGSYNKAIPIVCVFLKNKGQYTEVVKRTMAAGRKGEPSTASAQV